MPPAAPYFPLLLVRLVMSDSGSAVPRFSVVTVSFNAHETIERTIASVDRQRGEGFAIQYIVIDGGSTDGTQDILRNHSDQIDHCVSEPDEGLYDAMNKGIEVAEGDWIGIINSDDWYVPGAVKAVAEKVRDRPDADIVVGALCRVGPDDTVGKVIPPPRGGISVLTPNNHPATFVRREVYERLGRFDLDYAISADLQFALRAETDPETVIICCDQILACMREGGASAGFAGTVEAAKLALDFEGPIVAARVLARKIHQSSRRAFVEGLLPPRLREAARRWWWARNHELVRPQSLGEEVDAAERAVEVPAPSRQQRVSDEGRGEGAD